MLTCVKKNNENPIFVENNHLKLRQMCEDDYLLLFRVVYHWSAPEIVDIL